jgi:uncharacterized protein YbjT (DUF2867 family)
MRTPLSPRVCSGRCCGAPDFAANTLAWVPQIRSTGVVRGAFGDALTSPIHEREIAAVGVSALLHRKHAGRSYVLTGPQSLSQRDKIQLIGEAIGTELLWAEISPEQARRDMLAQGPQPMSPTGYLDTSPITFKGRVRPRSRWSGF